MNNGKSQMKWGVMLSYLNIGMNILLALCYTPFLLRSLGRGEYGLYSIAFAAVGLFSIFDMGLGLTNIRYTAKFRAEGKVEDERVLHGTNFLLYTFIGLFVLIVGLLFCSRTEDIFGRNLNESDIPRLKTMLQFVIVSLSLSFPLSVFKYTNVGYERFLFVRMMEFLNILLVPGVSIILLLLDYKSVELIIAISVINIIFLLLNACYSLFFLRIRFDFHINRSFLKELVMYSFWIFLASVSFQLNNNANQFVLAIFAGAIPVAIYSLGFNLVINFQSLGFAVSSVFLPRITKISSDNVDSQKEYNSYFIAVGRLQFYILALFLSGFIIFGKNFILLWAGSGYEYSYYVAIITMIPLSIHLIQTIGITILRAQNRQKYSSLLFVIMAIFNIVLSIFLSKYMGAIGCAISLALTWFIGHGVLMNIFYYKKIGLDIPAFWKQILKISRSLILPFIIGYLYVYFFQTDNWLNLSIGIVVFAVIYVINIIIFSFNDFEKNIILTPIINILKRRNS